MGRTLDQVIAALPRHRRKKVEARYRELKEEIESLGRLRRLAGKAQSEIASALAIKQPSVSKIESQADMYLSTLRSYVEALGGTLDLVVRLPGRPVLRLRNLGEIDPSMEAAAGRRRTAVKVHAKHSRVPARPVAATARQPKRPSRSTRSAGISRP